MRSPLFRSPAMRAALAALILAPLPAAADEMWQTNLGQVIWETDIEDVAVLLLTEDGGKQMRIFLPGLPFEVNGPRGVYFGFWTAEAGEFPCPMAMVDPMDRVTPFWGQFTLNFVQDSFPADWAGLLGECFSDTYVRVTGTAQTGG